MKKMMLMAALLVPGAIGARMRAPTPTPALLVLEKAQNSLLIVDPTSRAIVARVPVGVDPHEVAVADDGRTAYVSNYQGFGGDGGATITIVDLVAQQAVGTIPLGALRAPHGLDFASGKLFFTAERAKVVGRIDPATRAVDWVIGTGEDRTHMVVVSRDGNVVFTSNVNSPSVSIVEMRAVVAGGAPPNGPPPRGPANDWHVTNIPVGRGAEGMDLTPNGRELWVANAQDATISIVDVSQRRVVATIPSTKAANRLKITPDGRYALVSDMQGPELLVVDIATRTPRARVALSAPSEGILIRPDGARAYTTLNAHDAVAEIDLTTMTVVGEFKTGRGPDGLAWAAPRRAP
jgi:YVTN family beta-propeller protein